MMAIKHVFFLQIPERYPRQTPISQIISSIGLSPTLIHWMTRDVNLLLIRSKVFHGMDFF